MESSNKNLSAAQAIELQMRSLRSVRLAKAGNYKEAIAEFDDILRIDPQQPTIYYNRGHAREDMGDLAGALADYNMAIQLDPSYGVALNNRAILYGRLGKAAEAIADWSSMIKLEPTSSLAYYNRGVQQGRQEKFQEAIADLTKAIDLNPNFAAAYYARGQAFFNIEKLFASMNAKTDQLLPRAIADFTAALRLNPKDYQTYQDRGLVYLLMATDSEYQPPPNALPKAIEDFTQAIHLEALFPYYLRAQAYLHAGQYRQAMADLEAFLQAGGGEAYGNKADCQRLLQQLRQRL